MADIMVISNSKEQVFLRLLVAKAFPTMSVSRSSKDEPLGNEIRETTAYATIRVDPIDQSPLSYRAALRSRSLPCSRLASRWQ